MSCWPCSGPYTGGEDVDLTICPGPLHGTVTPPASKSQAHRAVLALALSGGTGTLSNLSPSQDIQATERCTAALKSGQPAGGDGLPVLDCGESGSTLRFLIPLSLVLRGGGHFTGRGRLMERPQAPYFDLFREKEIFYEQRDGVLTLQGRLKPGTYSLPGNVSSQFVTGLLYALPLLEGDSEIRLTTPLESRGYVDMTLDVLDKFGVTAEPREDGFHVPGSQRYQARDLTIEGDWSQAAFWYAANFMGGEVDIRGLDPDSSQGDKAVALDYWKLARPGDVELDVSQCPDLVPPLAAMSAVRRGETRLVNAARLRMKESDRLSSVAAALTAMGAWVEEGTDSLTLRGRGQLPGGGTVDCRNDHRIAMMAAVTASFCRQPVQLLGAECVDKSYPDFWNHFIQLGGKAHGLVLR